MYGWSSSAGRTLSFKSASAPVASAPAAPAPVVYVQAPTQYSAPASQLSPYVRQLTTAERRESLPEMQQQAAPTATPPSGPEPLPMPESYYTDSETAQANGANYGYALGIGAALLLLLLLAGKRKRRRKRHHV